MISVIDYGVGNLKSVEKALQYIGCDATITSDVSKVAASDAVVLPGVGAFDDAMRQLKSRQLDQPIIEFIKGGRPFLGICLGLQLLFESSEESVKKTAGLGVLPGKIIRIRKTQGLKIPHMGWNRIHIQNACPLFDRLPDEPYVYFVHSYYAACTDLCAVAATVEYADTMQVAFAKKNVFATQFHPEKSSGIGLQILKNWVRLIPSMKCE